MTNSRNYKACSQHEKSGERGRYILCIDEYNVVLFAIPMQIETTESLTEVPKVQHEFEFHTIYVNG